VARRDTVVHDYLTNTDHPGCETLMEGSLDVLGEFAAPTDYFRERLLQEGWEDELRYAADGPTSTAFALWKDPTRCLFESQWNGSVVIVAKCYVP
jgi:hypothetical protein